ncbi:hypothetical protein B0H14DRAFT_2635203 [Mycena olivaceomarginata]|nr:hypothetical protein B0H14DRAFT_2635203 [Mycena olivaceomarginata]
MPVNPALKARSKERPVRSVVPALQFVVFRPQYGADSASPSQALCSIKTDAVPCLFLTNGRPVCFLFVLSPTIILGSWAFCFLLLFHTLLRRIPQDYRAIKPRKTATFFGARWDYVSWIRKSSWAAERSKMAVDRKIEMNLQLARSGMVSYSIQSALPPSLLCRHRVENNQTQPSYAPAQIYLNPEVLVNPTFGTTCDAFAISICYRSRTTQLLFGLPASSDIWATSTRIEDSAQTIFDAAVIAQPVRLPLLPFLDEVTFSCSWVASQLLTLPICIFNFGLSAALFATSCHHLPAPQSGKMLHPKCRAERIPDTFEDSTFLIKFCKGRYYVNRLWYAYAHSEI